MEAKVFKTQCQTEREARDLAIYNEYNDLMSVKGQSKTVVMEHLMNKYGIHSIGTTTERGNSHEENPKDGASNDDKLL